jgi:two-component system, cell cycle sensor histidine kinase and response regulator CckA
VLEPRAPPRPNRLESGETRRDEPPFAGIATSTLNPTEDHSTDAPVAPPADARARTSRLFRSPAFAYAASVVATAATVGVRFGIAPWAQNRVVPTLFLVPVILGSYLGGLGPGLLATFLGAACLNYLFIEPKHSFLISLPVDLAQWLLLIATGVLISLLCEALHRQRRRQATISTQLRRANERMAGHRGRLQSMFDIMTEGIVVIDSDHNLLAANNAFRSIFGPDIPEIHSSENPVPYEVQLPDGSPLPRNEWPSHRALRGDFVTNLELVIVRTDTGRRFAADCTTAPLRDSSGAIDCVVVSYHDVTERKAQLDEIGRLTRIYATLSQVNQTLVRCATREELFEDICRVAIEFGRFRAVAISWADGSGPPRTVAHRSLGEGLVMPGWETGCGVLAELMGTGGPSLCNLSTGDARSACCHSAQERAGIGSCAAFPLELRGKLCGALSLCSHEPDFFKGMELQLLKEVASDISFALDKLGREAERLESDRALSESESRFRRLFQSAPLPLAFVDGDQVITDRNDRFVKVLGYTREDMPTLAEWWIRAYPDPAYRARLALDWATRVRTAAAEGRDIEPQEFNVTCKDGGVRLLEISGLALPGGTLAMFNDVTERRKAERQLQEREEQLRLYVEHCPAAVAMFDLDMRYLVVSRRWIEEYGLGERPLVGRSHYELFPEIPQRWVETHRRCLAGAVEKCDEDPFVRADGTTLWIRWEVRPWHRTDGSIGGIIIFSQDITAKKQTDIALRLFRELIERSNDAIHVADPATGRFLDANQGACRALGYTREELLNLSVPDIAPGIGPEAFEATGAKLRKEGHATLNIVHRRKDGTTYPAEANLSMVSLDQEYILAIVRDVTERTQAEAALRERTAFFEAQAEATPDAILVVDLNGKALLTNHRFIEIAGLPGDGAASGPESQALSLMAKRMKDPAPFLERVSYLYSHPDEVGHGELELADGRIFDRYSAPVRDAKGRCYGRIWTFRDITESRRIESQFLRTQRLEAIGTLSSGIAHDLNNILAPMLMAAGMLRSESPDPHNAELLDMMESSAQRGAKIVQQLLAFSRGIDGTRISVQLKHLIKDMVAIARETFPRNITVTERIDPNLCTVSADSTQIHQVLMNLCVNARDAMPAGGTLALRAENTEVAPAQAEAYPGAKPGPHVLLTVSDTGHGIPPGIIDRIFDPFFTTKGVGKGTGLGLSTAIGIVKSHGGFIAVTSAPGEGAAFQVYLPAEGGQVGAPEKPAGAAPRRGAGELVLVVDDEEAIRMASAAILQRWNYRVVDAPNGKEGLARFIEHSREIRLAVVDQMMPVMGGQALIVALRELNPALKVIAVTGMEQGEQRAELMALGVSEILMKPYTPGQLLNALSSALFSAPS